MAAGRISVHLGKTSWPPGRGSTAGQTLAPRGGDWEQHSLDCAVPGRGSLLPTAGDCVGNKASAAPGLP